MVLSLVGPLGDSGGEAEEVEEAGTESERERLSQLNSLPSPAVELNLPNKDSCHNQTS